MLIWQFLALHFNHSFPIVSGRNGVSLLLASEIAESNNLFLSIYGSRC
jgi:hypothetical protein